MKLKDKDVNAFFWGITIGVLGGLLIAVLIGFIVDFHALDMRF